MFQPAYVIGFLKYAFKGPITNPLSFYIFGAGIFALLSAAPHLLNGEFTRMVAEYFMTKHLPPTSLGQIAAQTVVGSTVAGAKWFLLTPRL